MRKSGRGGGASQKVAISPFEDKVPEIFVILARFLEDRALKTSGIFTAKVYKTELDALHAIIERDGTLAKDTSVFAAANLLDVMVNTLSEPAIPVQMFESVKLALVQSNDKDKIKCLRRLFASLPPGNRAFVVRMSHLVYELRNKQKHNKVDQEVVDHVFSYSICHGPDEASFGDTSSLLMQTIAKHHNAIFGKKLEEYSADKDKEFPLFISALRSACDNLADVMLPKLAPPKDPKTRRMTARSSRKSFGWDEVFAKVKPINNKGETNKVKHSPFVKELGKLLFQSKFGAAKKFVEKKTKEIENLRQAPKEEAVLNVEDGVYTGEKVDGKPHGTGKLCFLNGDIYEGAFVDGKMEGKGVLQMIDGGRYEGDFKEGLMSGKGTFTYPNGDIYEGSFEDDNYHGQGTYTSNTSVYEGNFAAGLRHGNGSFKTANFSYIGEYVNDQMCGMGIYTFKNGDEYKGEFLDSKFHGQGVFKTKTKSVEGRFEKGRYKKE